MFQWGHSLAIKKALYWSIPNTKVWSQPVCFNKEAITLHCYQSGVSILTDVFEVYVLQVKFNSCNYNSYAVIYITWLRQSCYVFTTQLNFNVHMRSYLHTYVYSVD